MRRLRLLAILTGLRYRRFSRGHGLRRRLRCLQSRPGDELDYWDRILGRLPRWLDLLPQRQRCCP
jgi:hypothetical protein